MRTMGILGSTIFPNQRRRIKKVKQNFQTINGHPRVALNFF